MLRDKYNEVQQFKILLKLVKIGIKAATLGHVILTYNRHISNFCEPEKILIGWNLLSRVTYCKGAERLSIEDCVRLSLPSSLLPNPLRESLILRLIFPLHIKLAIVGG